MLFEKLHSNIEKFTHIIHLADIHIRLTKRHKEYREVFQKLYDDIDKSPLTSLICVAGDVCHSKSELSPECVQMVSDFLWNLSERRPTILIPGNHDATLSNKTRMDSLSPIVNTLTHNNLFYLKESKLYGIGNVLFNNMCIFDDPETYIRGSNIPEMYRNQYKHIIALFHGPVDRSVTDTGFAISNPAIMPELFDWHDIALLGDIHRRQNVQEEMPEKHKPCVHYPGSLIQQNHGEALHPHGYTVWDLSTNNYKYVEVPNDYGYFTIDLNGSTILTDLSDIPKKTYLRIRCLDCIPSEVKAAEAKISTLTEIVETSRIRIESEADKKAKEVLTYQHVDLASITSVDYQGKLIAEFLKEKLNINDKDVIDQILIINRDTNTEIKKDEFARNLKWTPIRFEWDNMFAYGEGNVIDFTKMNGVYGVFGPNTCGKSSIFSAICFCLFDKWERGFKAIVARNSSKTNFKCKFEFQISGVSYFIEKTGETTRTGNVKVDVNFWRIIDGKNEDLTDQMRRKTNDVIRDYIGTFEDFILTTLSIQTTTKNNINFIDMGNTERKDLLVQFMGLNVFDRLYEIASARSKDLAAQLKPHKEKNYIKELDDSEFNLKTAEISIRDCQDAIDDISRQIKFVNDTIVEETSKLIKLDLDVPNNIDPLIRERDKLSAALPVKSSERGGYIFELTSLKSNLDKLNEDLSKVVAEDLVKAHQIYNDFKKKIENELHVNELKRVQIGHKQEKLDKLKKHKYDPNCKFCVENIFVKDARKTEGEIHQDQIDLEKSSQEIEKLRKQIKEWEWVESAYQNYTKLLSDHSKAKDEYTALNTKILLLEKDIEKMTQSFQDIQEKIRKFNENKTAVLINHQINANILSYKNAINKLESQLNTKRTQLLSLTGTSEVLKKQIKIITDTVNSIIQIEENRKLYDYYSQAVGRNGIPYQVICYTIPEIVHEVNSILTQITGFTIEIETDEKNITPYVNYETKGRWPIEMTSGFERFVASVALRVALSNVTNLPRTNFLIIDEGFSALDSHNMQSMSTLFTYLKSHYDFVMIVSHLDIIKDFVDNTIEIKQEKNFSQVIFK